METVVSVGVWAYTATGMQISKEKIILKKYLNM